MKLISKPVDMSKVRTIVYHLSDGEVFTIDKDTIDHGVDFGFGDICDTSDIDGVIHFFPRGSA